MLKKKEIAANLFRSSQRARAAVNERTWKCQLTWFPKKLISGEESRPFQLLMMRCENGRWIYRHPTDDEAADFDASDAW
jgi:hypothetical protein